MKNQFLLFLAVFCTFTGFAQINFEPGYIINNQGAKTECLIRNVAWKNSPLTFDYKPAEGAQAITANLSDFTEFNVSGYTFKRFTVNLDRSTGDYDRMSVTKEPEYLLETIYLRKLTQGDAVLYKYEDGNLIRFFYSKGNDVPVQLVYKPYRDGEKIGHNYSFKGQLYNLMKDKSTDRDKYKFLNYDEKDLTRLFLKYNGATEEEIKSNNSGEKSVFHLKVTPGINFASSNNSKKDAEGSFDLKSKPQFRIGLEAEWVLGFNKNKWSLFIEPNYQKYEDSGSKSYGEGLSQIVNLWQVSYQYIDIPLGIRHYLFLNQNAKIFINVAYQYSFVMGESGSTFNYKSAFSSYERKAKASNSSGVLAGVGFSYKALSIEARYNFRREIFTNYGDWSSKYSSYGILLGYKIF